MGGEMTGRRVSFRGNRFFGDRQFYRKVLLIAIPIMVQNGITNFVGMLDNIMVGRLGTDPMSGVAIVNQLMFIFYLCIFGGLSGIGIFTAQFYGKGDNEGIRYTVRLQILAGILLTAAAAAVFFLSGGSLVRLYLQGEEGTGSVADTFRYAGKYLAVMYAGMLPFAVSQVYSSTLRNTGETIVPMYAGIAAVAVNLVGNYILIYGKFGMPALGVQGAAAATVLSRFAELGIVAFWTHRHKDRYPFAGDIYRHLLKVPAELTGKVIRKAFPLLLNETLWAGGQAVLIQNYSIRGLSAVAALNISQTIANVFNVSFIAMGSAIAIVLGQMLGAGETEKAKQDAVKLIVLSEILCLGVGIMQFAVAGLFPLLYNTDADIRALAAGLIRISAVCMPIHAYVNAAYFILRSGGKTLSTFFFDSGYCWLISVPLAFLISHYTSMPLLRMFLVIQLAELIKCAMGHRMVRMGSWAVNLTQ